MDNKVTNPKKSYAKKVFMAILYLTWCGLIVGSFDRLDAGESIAWYLKLLILAPVLALPFSIYPLKKQEADIRKQYEEYLTEIKTIVDSIIDSGHINEIDSDERHKIIKWAERLSPSVHVSAPRIFRDYVEYSIGGFIVGLMCGGAVLYLIEKIGELI